MPQNKQVIDDEELGHVDAGRISPTWEPIDENCPVCNQVDECPFHARRGHYDNCPDCKLFNQID